MSPTPLAAEPTEQLGDRVNLRAVLRAATADLHAHIDRAMPLARSAPTLADYLTHLLLLRDWLGALGQAMTGLNGLADEQAAVLADAEQAAALIGHTVPAPRDAAGAEQAALRALDDGAHADAARLGVRYVIEGSHLGGKVLRRRWGERLAPHPLGYLGGGAPDRWPAFLNELAAARSPDERAAACAGAVLAFQLLQRLADAAAPAAHESRA